MRHFPRPLALTTLLALLAALAVAIPAAPPADLAAAPPAQTSCEPQPIVPIGEGFFTDISAASGIQLGNFDAANPVVANDHTRVAFVDLDGDGWDDIVMHNLTQIDKKPYEHLVFANNGDGTFRDIADESGLRDVQSAFLAFADVDNDGDQDCFAGVDTGITPAAGLTHQLLLNDGQGHFTRQAESGLEGRYPPDAAIALFADYNGDGNLDMFLGNGSTSLMLSDQLFIGHGDGTFEDGSDHLRETESIVRATNGAVACDYDDDHDLDIFVSVYGAASAMSHAHNVLWENDGQGNFVNVARERGFEALATGNYWLRSTRFGRDPEPVPPAEWMGGNGFGLQCEDVNADGRLDVWLANISHPISNDYDRKWSDPSALLINQGPAAGYRFENAYLDAGLPFNEGDLGGSMADFDNDGRMDLAMSRESKYEANYLHPEQQGWFGLFHQQPDGTFAGVGMTSGINDPDDPAPTQHQRAKASGGHVWSDIDHDGDLDLLAGAMQRVTETGRANYLFRNDIGSRNAWLAVRLDTAGGAFNRDGIGTRVELLYPDRILARELKANRGMDNADDTRVLHFGLGDLGCAPTVRVTWPNGEVRLFDGRAVGQNRYVTLRYGEGVEATPVPTSTPAPTATPTSTASPTSTATPLPPRTYVHLPLVCDRYETDHG